MLAHGDHAELALAEIGKVDVRDLKLAAAGDGEVLHDVDDGVVIEVKAGDDVIALGVAGLLLDGDGLAVRVELHDAKGARVLHVIAQHGGAGADVFGLVQQLLHAVMIEDVVAQREADAVVPDEPLADLDGVRDAAGRLLLLVGDADAEVLPVAEQADERLHLTGRGDDQDLRDAAVDQQGQRIIDHRLVVYGDQ